MNVTYQQQILNLSNLIYDNDTYDIKFLRKILDEIIEYTAVREEVEK
jgi:hypothetical protein